MGQLLQVRHKGIYTSPNEFSSVPDGALLKANNCILTVDNILESRRGFDRISVLPDSADRFSRFEVYQDVIMATYSNSKLAYKNGATFTALSGTYADPDSLLARRRFLLANSCLYMTTAAGIYKQDAYNATPTLAGMYKGLDLQLTLDSSTGTAVAADNQLAYRVLWGIRDAQNNLILGPPSGIAIIVNPTGGTTKDIDITFTIPSGITTSHFYQIYRSKASGGDDITPDDNLGLVIENNPTAGELVTGTISVTDSTTDDLLGTTIYTAPSIEGIAYANERPPQADDIEEFSDSICYANIKSKHRKEFTILATGGTAGIAFNDTLVINGVTYTAKGTETIASGYYSLSAVATTTGDTTNANPTLTNVASSAGLKIGRKITGTNIPANTFIGAFTSTTISLVDSAGAPVNATGSTAGVTLTITPMTVAYSTTAATPSQNIYDTAESLIRVINRYASNTGVYAYYLSAPGDLPGKILIEERGLGGSSFALTASAHGSAFNPVLPTSGTTVSSSNDDFQNAIMFSKTGKGEAVPLGNIRRVGSANNAIRRIKKLRNSLFIYKEREGIFRMTGTSPENFQIELFDSSAKLLAPDSVAVVNNQVWALCDQGITTTTEGGVSVVSRPIEDILLEQFGASFDALRYYTFGVGYETERQYFLWTVSTSADTVPSQALVFNIFTQSFTRWPLAKTTAIVNPVDDKMYLGDGSTYNLDQERKGRNYTDYVDYGVSVTVSSVSSTTVNLVSSSEVEVGDLLYQSTTLQSVITEVQPGYVVTRDALAFTAGAATVYKAIDCEVEYAPATGANPGTAKQFSEIAMLFKTARFDSATVSFATDNSAYFEDVTLAGSRTGLWGLFPWGDEAWGGTGRTVPIRTYIPLEKQRGSYLRVKFQHRQGYGSFKLLGFSLPFRDTNSKVIGK